MIEWDTVVDIERYIKERDVFKHWKYFLSLEKRFKETEDYLYHGIETNGSEISLINGASYSNYFKQLLILTASEFECLSKELIGIKSNNIGINKISKEILNKYPRIIETEIGTDYVAIKPLCDWCFDVEGKRRGLIWWDAYNALKHEGEEAFSQATFENCLLAMSSLYVLNLYNIESAVGNLDLATDTLYFKCQYTTGQVLGYRGSLPDFGNKKRMDVKAEMEQQSKILGKYLEECDKK